MSKALKKQNIEHLLQSVAAITQHDSFVIIGTGAVIARVKPVPLEMMMTREIDIYAESERSEALSDLIDGTLGEGSPFDAAFGYYAHGVGEKTACMPRDWRTRAIAIPVRGYPGVVCLCPEANDIAISKACAWRDKDIAWLKSGLGSGTIRIDILSSRLGSIDNENAPTIEELRRRIASIWPTR